MNLHSRLSIPPHVMSRPVGDETVLLDLASGQYFGLDRVGKHIWECISGGNNLAQTVDSLVAAYDVTDEQARQDVLEFAQKLVERGLLAGAPAGE